MNTKLLMLGILLIAGLSFAQPDGYNWMEYLSGKYYCNYMFLYDQDTVACGDGIDAYFDCSAMSSRLQDLNAILRFERGNMCYYSGCYGEQYASTTGFRPQMLAYSTNSMQFRSLFLSGLRSYISEHPEGRGPISEELQAYMGSYVTCVQESTGDPCDMCPDT